MILEKNKTYSIHTLEYAIKSGKLENVLNMNIQDSESEEEANASLEAQLVKIKRRREGILFFIDKTTKAINMCNLIDGLNKGKTDKLYLVSFYMKFIMLRNNVIDRLKKLFLKIKLTG